MNKAYSNKALPAGTVLREWRIEDVLGVGGFGIVYKAKGIYFNELVAIKEYFPSSISERDSEDTVVPIDSAAEEVHALGLKKFVEEAKLLWNLSTPTRHPNIVSVRSLFEVHGTAYIVMDFEDGVSLSKMLKQGRRFNERSLWNILRPIAEGLEMAHRVGVLHRDIKPPNILINEDNRPVLIDFGSARFEAADATSTSVTFHTPPYAAIEQYVKTYPQGPWTDIYALGVVMHECITGEKPAEVLERLHTGLGKPLAEGKWPGYSKRFLAAIDAAMTVKPEERPQQLHDWLALFGKDQADDAPEGDESTRFFAKQVETEAIVPVAATPKSDRKAPVETRVPADPKEAKFKRAGEETGASKKLKSVKETAEKVAPPAAAKPAAGAAAAATAAAATSAATGKTAKDSPPESESKKPNKTVLIGAAAAAILVAGVGAYSLSGGGSVGDTAAPPASSEAAPAVVPGAPEPAVAVNADTVADTAQAPAEPSEDPAAAAALGRESARAAAAEARLKAMQKAAAKAAQAPKSDTAAATAQKPGRKADTASASADDAGGVSPAKLSEFYSIVDDARGMARRVIRSGSSENAQLARNYDSNLQTLRASMGGIKSNKEADRLIKQAKQTRAYVQFLAKQ